MISRNVGVLGFHLLTTQAIYKATFSGLFRGLLPVQGTTIIQQYTDFSCILAYCCTVSIVAVTRRLLDYKFMYPWYTFFSSTLVVISRPIRSNNEEVSRSYWGQPICNPKIGEPVISPLPDLLGLASSLLSSPRKNALKS